MTTMIAVDVNTAALPLTAPAEPVPAPVGAKLPKLHRGLTPRGQNVAAAATGAGMLVIATATVYLVGVMLHVQ